MHLAQSRLDRAQKWANWRSTACALALQCHKLQHCLVGVCATERRCTKPHAASWTTASWMTMRMTKSGTIWQLLPAPLVHTAACKLFSWLPGTRVKQAWQILAASKHITRLVPLYTLTLLRPCPSLLALDISNISVVSTSAQDLCKQVPSLAFLLQTAVAVMISSAHAGLGLAEGALQKHSFQWSRGLIGKPLRSALRPSTRPLRCSKPGTVCRRAVYSPFHVHHSVWRTCLTIGS